MASDAKKSGERTPEEEQARTVIAVSLVLGVPALIALAIYALALPHTGSVFSVALLTAVSAFAAGALLGFLFGIPRTAAHGAADGVAPADGEPKPVYEPNTNLEQISDWLTKILVGVGLVQIGQVSGALDDLATALEPGLGDDPTGHSVAVMLLVSFAILGFLSAYLFTRLLLQNAFEPFRKALEKQEDSLTSALPVVRSQLDPADVGPTPEQLREALHDASSGIRDEAFYLARNQRRASWRVGDEDRDGHLVELTIPVFDALIALDEDRCFHRNRAELAYALKDKGEPTAADYTRARATLSTAIEIRGASGAVGFSLYEFNRAYCNIELDPASKTGQASDEELAKEICADLEVAAATDSGRGALLGSKKEKKKDGSPKKGTVRETVQLWLERNKANKPVQERVAALAKVAAVAL